MSSMNKIRLERHARYQQLRTLALRLLFTATPCAVLLLTKYVAKARSFPADYVKEHGIDETDVSDVTFGRRG